MRRGLARLLALLAVGYVGAAGYLKVREPVLVYPRGDRQVAEPPARFALRQRALAFPAADGTRLSAWIVPARAADSTGFWLLVCHGNYGSIGFGDRPEFYASARDIGLNVLAFDYRGFGASAGEPEEQGLYADALGAWHYLTDSLGVPPDRIIAFGHSLGSGVAIELATRVPVAAVVVEGAYTSIPDRGQELYPWLPVGLIASQRFASIDKIGRLAVPVLLIHSPEDDIVPFSHGERLYAAARPPRQLVEVRGGHDEAFLVDRARYFGALRALVDSLRGAGRDPGAPRSGAGQAPAVRE